MSAFADEYYSWMKQKHGDGTPPVRYFESHLKRYRETERLISSVSGKRALEIGAMDYTQIFLADVCGYSDVWGSYFSTDVEQKLYRRTIGAAGRRVTTTAVSVDIERELFPVEPATFDLVMMCEVIEHMDIDPMFALAEINRVLRLGGKLILTTPNSCSSQCTWKGLLGYRPHFHMQYTKDRSPNRHNYEHDVHSVRSLVDAAGFDVDILVTKDVFDEPNVKALEFIKKHGFPTEHRGDDIMVVCTKVAGVRQRWPKEIYA